MKYPIRENTHTLSTLSVSAASLLLVLGMSSGSALANQDMQPETGEASAPYSANTQMADPSLAAENLPEEKLEAFAKAQESVDETRVAMTSKLQNTQDPQEAMAVREKANMEMLEKVEQAGLTREEYNTIARAVAMNPDVAAKIDGYR